jgi:hypothetical protein
VVDMTAIAGLVSSLKAATDISKAMIGLRDTALVQGKVIELQGIILSAQQSALSAQSDQFTLLERVRDLETKLAELEAWDAEKDRYEMKDVCTGAFAYVVKPAADTGEPAHWLCASCYGRSHKAVLQQAGRVSNEHLYQCPDSKSAIRVHWSLSPTKFAEIQKRSGN